MYITLTDLIKFTALVCQIVTVVILALNSKSDKK